MKILLLGANGQVGWELQKVLPAFGNIRVCNRADLDLTNFDAIRQTIALHKPDCIINAAAYTAVDKAESEPELAHNINAEAVAVLAEEAKEHDSWLIHYSTDYVFDGTKQEPYSESDSPNPINLYGKSKLEGEGAIEQSGCKYLIFRTSWVIGAHGSNFAKTILRLSQERESLKVIDDQLGAPTTAHLIAKITFEAVKKISTTTPWPCGVYHLTPHGDTTWWEVAKYLIDLAKNNELFKTGHSASLHAIATKDYPTLAKRPLNSRLNNQKLESMLSFNLPHWKSEMVDTANEIIEVLKAE